MTAVRLVWRNRTLAGVALLAMLAACGKKDGSNPPPTGPVTGPTAIVTGLVLGAGSGLPLANVTVTASPSAGAGATSNSFGIFTLTIPANVRVAVTGTLSGFAPHPTWLNLATGENRSSALVMAPIGGTQTVFANAGGTVVDPGSKSTITVPAGFVTGTSTAQVQVTGIDPTTQQVLAMPGTFASQLGFGGTGGLEPIAMAELNVGDGAGTSFPLAQPAVVELHVPPANVSDPRLGLANLVNILRYDEPAGVWRPYADGVVVASSVDGQPAVRFTANELSWFAAGFLFGTNACIEGTVTSSSVPVAGATVQAYPGNVAVTNASGFYRVSVPPECPVQLIATRPGVGTVSAGSAATVSTKLGTGCVTTGIALTVTGAPSTFSVSGQLHRGRDGFGIQRDAATVKITANNGPQTPLNGARVELIHSGTTDVLPLLSPGVYGIVSGQPNLFNLASGSLYTLRIDLEPDGVFDGQAQIQMPAKPVITFPEQDGEVGATFAGTWTDPLTSNLGYSVRYVGSIEATTLGSFPSIFALQSPAIGTTIGNGVGQPQFNMPNDPLASGPHLFRLWATNGPIRYPVGGSIQFTDPNIVTTRIIGRFSAIVRADSVSFGSLGDGLP